MDISTREWKDGIGAGALAGIVWGWIALATNRATGAFTFEEGLFYEISTFAVGGAVLGVVVGGFLVLARDLLPFKRLLAKAIFVSTSIWLLLRTAGVALSLMNPYRYHPAMDEALQGFLLSIVMGGLIGLLWERRLKTA